MDSKVLKLRIYFVILNPIFRPKNTVFLEVFNIINLITYLRPLYFFRDYKDQVHKSCFCNCNTFPKWQKYDESKTVISGTLLELIYLMSKLQYKQTLIALYKITIQLIENLTWTYFGVWKTFNLRNKSWFSEDK